MSIVTVAYQKPATVVVHARVCQQTYHVRLVRWPADTPYPRWAAFMLAAALRSAWKEQRCREAAAEWNLYRDFATWATSG